MRFKDLYEEHKDTIRLDVFIEEGIYGLVENLLLKYQGRLMDIVIDHERAKELYAELFLAGKSELANRFLNELGLQKSISDYIRRECVARVKSGSSKPIPSVRDLQELIGPL